MIPVIPAAWTIAKYKTIAKPLPAPDGHVWYVIKGSATNNSKETRNVNSVNSYLVTDSAKNRIKADTVKCNNVSASGQ